MDAVKGNLMKWRTLVDASYNKVAFAVNLYIVVFRCIVKQKPDL